MAIQPALCPLYKDIPITLPLQVCGMPDTALFSTSCPCVLLPSALLPLHLRCALPPRSSHRGWLVGSSGWANWRGAAVPTKSHPCSVRSHSTQPTSGRQTHPSIPLSLTRFANQNGKSPLFIGWSSGGWSLGEGGLNRKGWLNSRTGQNNPVRTSASHLLYPSDHLGAQTDLVFVSCLKQSVTCRKLSQPVSCVLNDQK